MFCLDRFVSDCRLALAEGKGGHKAVREVVARAVSDPSAVLAALGEPNKAQAQKLYQAADLTIVNLVWGPHMTVTPHDHRMWAVIGVYTGCEDNIYWRRVGGGDGKVEAAGAKALRARDCTVLGRDIIHSVTNPIPRLTGAIHIYGGDLFSAERSEWDPETLQEERYDAVRNLRQFDEANVAHRPVR